VGPRVDLDAVEKRKTSCSILEHIAVSQQHIVTFQPIVGLRNRDYATERGYVADR
jgi:hypothetical protein